METKDDQNYSVGEPATVMKRGSIYVVAHGDVINGQVVKVDPAGQKFGATGDGAIDIKNAVFKKWIGYTKLD